MRMKPMEAVVVAAPLLAVSAFSTWALLDFLGGIETQPHWYAAGYLATMAIVAVCAHIGRKR